MQVALVFPNNDPAASMVAFYGCLLAEVVPVPIEVPLTRKVKSVWLVQACHHWGVSGSAAVECSVVRSECVGGYFLNGFSSQQDVDRETQRCFCCF